MIKFMSCLKRNPNMSREEFHNYWLNQHAPLFQTYAADLKAVRYVQHHTADTLLNENMKKSRGYREEYDGVGEIWWESEKDFLEVVNSPQGLELRKLFAADEARFTDLKNSSGFFTIEHVLMDNMLPNLRSR